MKARILQWVAGKGGSEAVTGTRYDGGIAAILRNRELGDRAHTQETIPCMEPCPKEPNNGMNTVPHLHSNQMVQIEWV